MLHVQIFSAEQAEREKRARFAYERARKQLTGLGLTADRHPVTAADAMNLVWHVAGLASRTNPLL